MFTQWFGSLRLLLTLGVYFAPIVIAQANTSIASIYVSGIVPSYFSVTSHGQPGELDLASGSIVSNRTIGLLHFKFNENIQTLTVSSSTLSGKPEDSGGNAYQFGGTGDFFVAFRAGCTTVDAAYNTPFALTNVGTDVKSVLAGALINTGIEEDCEVTASYTGTSNVLPLAGRFDMRIIITMVSF